MDVTFTSYSPENRNECLALFDSNCPEYFAPNERKDYENFLVSKPAGYEVCIYEKGVAGAFGLFKDKNGHCRLDWILLNPDAQGIGIGSIIMDRVIAQAKDYGADRILIATSHKADRFFEKKGAVKLSETKDGWGPDMHRIDMVINL